MEFFTITVSYSFVGLFQTSLYTDCPTPTVGPPRSYVSRGVHCCVGSPDRCLGLQAHKGDVPLSDTRPGRGDRHDCSKIDCPAVEGIFISFEVRIPHTRTTDIGTLYPLL